MLITSVRPLRLYFLFSLLKIYLGFDALLAYAAVRLRSAQLRCTNFGGKMKERKGLSVPAG